MRVVDRLAQREQSWRELETLLEKIKDPRKYRAHAPFWRRFFTFTLTRSQRMRLIPPADLIRLSELYRSACTDLMLAEAHDLPREMVGYLHGLVGRAHNTLYRAQGFRFSDWGKALFGRVPRQLRADPALRLSALVFVGSFVLCGLLAAARPGFSTTVMGEPGLDGLERMYAEPVDAPRADGLKRSDTLMAGFYIRNNTSIGLQCFAFGLFFGLGTVYVLLSNGMLLGTAFGHMATSPHAPNFFTFVTAHSVFELTAIVFSGAAGLRLGYGLIDTKGQSRLASLRREARNALPTVGASVILFILAAFLEGFVSASPLPYSLKAGIALASAALLVAYVGLGGRERERGRIED